MDNTLNSPPAQTSSPSPDALKLTSATGRIIQGGEGATGASQLGLSYGNEPVKVNKEGFTILSQGEDFTQE
jgi:hypothetical protein